MRQMQALVLCFYAFSGRKTAHTFPENALAQANAPRGVCAPGGEIRGAGRVGPFSLFVADAAFAAPRERKGLSATIPQIASLPGASPTFSRHDAVMLRMNGSTDEGRAYGP
jgi:hypothetical protein